jgi:beta-lactamase regulating signal transducer with metallopeptidase domain
MNSWAFFDGTAVFGLLLDTAIKGVILLGVVELVFITWRRASAAVRHAVRFAAVVVAMILPLLGAIMPTAEQPLWPVKINPLGGNEFAVSLAFSGDRPEASVVAKVIDSRISGARAATGSANAIVITSGWTRLALFAWISGAIVAGLPSVYGMGIRRRLLRHARSVTDDDWQKALASSRERLIVLRTLRFLESNDVNVPITWGTFRPMIIVPESATKWTLDRKCIVLMHELAHVRRCDYLTQTIAQIACALFWFNPLLWIAAAAMRADREQACDDLVIASGCRASDYTGHLLEIAANIRSRPIAGAIAIARGGGLEARIEAALDPFRSRRTPGFFARAGILSIACALALTIAAQTPGRMPELNHLRERQLAHLEKFAAQKEAQADALAAKNGEQIIPEFRKFFAAAKKGEWQTVTNTYADFKRRHPQYSSTGDLPHTSYWSTILETCLAYYDVVWGKPDHVQLAIDGFMKSIPRGSIYFGGTDPGRGLPTAFSKDHAKADPFFTLTQNALADNTYLQYLADTYGSRIYTPTTNDSQTAFASYSQDAKARLEAGKLKPGENVVKHDDGSIGVSGQVAVMEINARLAKIIFDKNPERDFYIEESFPLEWMYPYLSPAGQVMKINRAPLREIPERDVRKDFDYWNSRIQKLLGARVAVDGSSDAFLRDVEAIYVTRTKKVDARYLQNDWAQRAFSKWRSGIAGVYAWRATQKQDVKMSGAAETALRQAYLLCPKSPEVVYRFVNFLAAQGRVAEAKRLIAISRQAASDDQRLQDMLSNLEKSLK